MLSESIDSHRYSLELAYNGHLYHGWQMQPNAKTVQGTMNDALSLLLGKSINLVGAGRTDTGVHASHFVAHFDYVGEGIDTEQLKYKLNSLLGKSIRIDRIELAKPDFHSRFSASQRTYHYLISLDSNPFLNEFSWQIRKSPDLIKMNTAARFLIGEKDFTSFARLHTDTKTNICRVHSANWSSDGTMLIFKITADRFLRNMVRAIVGTLVDIGIGKLETDSIEQIMRQKDRSIAGQSAPPQGLFLSRIDYPEDLMKVAIKPPFPSWI